MPFERVALETDVPEGGVFGVTLASGDRVCLVRWNGDLFAISDECTHAGFPMTEGSVGSACDIECGLHGAVFDLRDGSVLSGPADEAIKTYQIKTDEGSIWVESP